MVVSIPLGRKLSDACWAALLSLLATSSAGATTDCRALQAERDQLATAAIGAEIALLHSIRQRLCPLEEALAGQANALDATAGQPQSVNFERYIRCRRMAEQRIAASRPLLFRNRLGFTYYTEEGARLAREADGARGRMEQECPDLR